MSEDGGQTTGGLFITHLNTCAYIPVDLTTLSVQQLSEVKKQIDEGCCFADFAYRSELEHLSQSFTQLRQARLKFLDCIKSISESGKSEYEGRSEELVETNIAGKPILVPLTPSLYVQGTLKNAGKVLVDIGTGYFVEKVQLKACTNVSLRKMPRNFMARRLNFWIRICWTLRKC
jgi:prefoldin alpha subunit